MKKIQQISIKGILRKDNKVLLLKTTTNKWELPGGRMDFGENVKQSLQREIKEELGFEKVRLGNLVNDWSFTSIREEINYHFIIFDFEIYTKESKIRLSDEHVEYKWIGINDFEKMDMREGHKESLKKYFER